MEVLKEHFQAGGIIMFGERTQKINISFYQIYIQGKERTTNQDCVKVQKICWITTGNILIK